jgi:hypothetical protein
MGKISDLWVKLGLKKEGFDKGIDDVKKKTKETENGFGKLKAAGIAVWAAIGAAVVSFVKDFRDKTQAVGDAWAIMAARAEARWKVMLESLTNGFDNLRQRMNDAADAAEAKHLYGMEFADISTVKDCDAVILAVAHDAFKSLTQADFETMFKKGDNCHKVLVDVKGLLDRSEYEAAGYHYWRL